MWIFPAIFFVIAAFMLLHPRHPDPEFTCSPSGAGQYATCHLKGLND